ncbi:hypothetical protein PRZ48_004404 [Zasmidium cellare]|uniref:Uncharacterized protein n=1 Tax=Zasmidium cellare TaxID=395010 RepID=A0ABR0EQ37_ZASCE|nr:hypothetical protein PRZ48_004404 [Zasmidium cellare]
MPPKRGRRNVSSSSSNSPPAEPPLPAYLNKSAPPPAGLFDPESLRIPGDPMSSPAVDDLRAMGFSEQEVTGIVGYPEFRVDHMAQVPNAVNGGAHTPKERRDHRVALYKHIKKTGLRELPADAGDYIDLNSDDEKTKKKSPKGQKAKSPKGKKTKRNVVPIPGSENWILFDPIKGLPFPPNIESPPKHAKFTQYEYYKPGNPKILAYSTLSDSVTLKTTPAEFEGYEVSYLAAGPKLVKVKSPRTQPTRKTRESKEKEPEPAQPANEGEKEKTLAPTRKSPRSKRTREVDDEEGKEAEKEGEAAPAPKRRKAAPKKNAGSKSQ